MVAVLLKDCPFCTVNPLSTAPVPSLFAKVTTGPSADPPLMIVWVAPATPVAPEVTVMALPLKSISSLYVPGETRTVSPAFAASIPA